MVELNLNHVVKHENVQDFPFKKKSFEPLAWQHGNCQTSIISNYFEFPMPHCHQAILPRNMLPWSRHRILNNLIFLPYFLYGFCALTLLYYLTRSVKIFEQMRVATYNRCCVETLTCPSQLWQSFRLWRDAHYIKII